MEITWVDNILIEGAAVLAVGFAGGFWFFRWRDHKVKLAMGRQNESILDHARREAEAIMREARLTATEEALKLREQNEKAFAARTRELTEMEHRLAQRETLINAQLEGLVQQEKSLAAQHQEMRLAREATEAERQKLQRLQATRQEELQKLGRLSEGEARALLLKEVEQQALRDAADLSRHVMDAARTRAEEEARRIISLAIQRYAGVHTFETTTATVALQGDEIKGRIIGAFEAATGITVLIDDTPNAVVLSGFDPVRREIAREAMQRLILDGRIHPTRI